MLLIFYSYSSHHGFLQHIFNTIKILRRFLRSGQSHEVSDLFVGHSAIRNAFARYYEKRYVEL